MIDTVGDRLANGDVGSWQQGRLLTELLDYLLAGPILHFQADIDLGGGRIAVAQETRYPWDGAVTLTITPQRTRRFAINIRIPGWARNEPVPTPSVRERFLGDLYANLMSFERDGSSATFIVYHQPLVGWIWAGGFIVALGALIGLMRPRKRPPARVTRVTEEEETVAV